ncbi:MAG: hypothetical protein HOV81_36595 [Kofleriaceae bacterium]|nr:hypothetical protein [Kofleriaceae bacterium]
MRITTVAERARVAIVVTAAAGALLASLLTRPAIVPPRSRDMSETTSRLPSLAPARVCAGDSFLLLCTSSPADLEVLELARFEASLGR